MTQLIDFAIGFAISSAALWGWKAWKSSRRPRASDSIFNPPAEPDAPTEPQDGDDAPHVVRLLNGKYAVRRWNQVFSTWDLFGGDRGMQWWPIGNGTGRTVLMAEVMREAVDEFATPETAWHNYVRKTAAMEAEKKRRADVGTRVTLTHD